MRKAFLLGCWIIAVCVVAAADKSLDLPKSTGRVNDFAGVINPQAKKSLARLCLELDEKTHAQIAVVTIASTGHTPIADYAFALFNHWGIGHKGDNRGLLVLLAISDRHWRITTGRGFETLFPRRPSGEHRCGDAPRS